MKKFMKVVGCVALAILLCFGFFVVGEDCCFAQDATAKYYTIYADETKKQVLFLKGDDVSVGDNYLSKENKFYEIVKVDDESKTAIAKFVRDENLPKFNLKRSSKKVASAAKSKKVGVYHTHNDECYFTPDGVDSVYGAGGIHDVGKEFVLQLNKLGIETVYREDLHLPHNSGAYSRSQVTAAAILNQGVDGIFDLHRDSTKRSEYLAKVDGVQMSAIRMVIGAASANFEENKNFAYTIKAYADEVYPGLIKDIYIGKGNYNQQLTTRAMLFEMGCENIEKDLVKKSTPYLAKVIDAVLYGTDAASEETIADVTIEDGQTGVPGLVNSASQNAGSNETLWVVLGIIGASLLVMIITLILSKKSRYKVGRFFSEMFAGIFGKRKAK